MAYTPTEWETADIVTATRMNALETAVGEINMSYTPNVWSDGDILTAAKMNALEQAVASGGGGGSSFVFPVFTLTDSSNPAATCDLSYAECVSLIEGAGECDTYPCKVDYGEDITFQKMEYIDFAEEIKIYVGSETIDTLIYPSEGNIFWD